MKHLFSVAVLTVALTSASAFAQAAPAPAPGVAAPMHHHVHNPHKAAMRMGKKLGLSPDQTAKLEPILADRRQKVQALRADTSLTDAQRKQQMHAIHKDTRMQMGSVLTPSQMQQMKAMHHRHDKPAAQPAGV